ncbi:MAG: alpha-galactosidase, partial [Planctomycetota bacterium]
PLAPATEDWLIRGAPRPAAILRDESGRAIVLDNGLLRRTIRVTSTAATVGLDDLMTGRALLRAVQPEARVTLDGVTHD